MLSLLAVSTVLVSCHTNSNGPLSREEANSRGEMDPAETYVVIDNVKVRSDPKGGWFGPNLRYVYLQGDDTPDLYCDSGPSLPTGKPVTVFFRPIKSTPNSSACDAVVAVVEGRGVWKDGRALNMTELRQLEEVEVHFIEAIAVPLGNPMELAWQKPKPIGTPCTVVPDAPSWSSAQERESGNCSIVVVYRSSEVQPWDRNTVEFVHWNVTGILRGARDASEGPEPIASDVVQKIIDQYGSKYVVFK